MGFGLGLALEGLWRDDTFGLRVAKRERHCWAGRWLLGHWWFWVAEVVVDDFAGEAFGDFTLILQTAALLCRGP